MNKLQNLTNRKKAQRRQIRREEKDIMYQYLSAEYCPFQFSFHENVLSVTNGLHYAAGFILILQGGKGRERQKDSYLQYLIKDRRVPGQKAVVCAFGDIKVLTLQGNALEPCICRSRYVKIQLTFSSLEMLTGFNYKLRKSQQLINVIRIRKNLENQKIYVSLQCSKKQEY